MLLVLFAVLTTASSVPICQSDSQVGACLRPLIDKWEQIRKIEVNATNILFPIPFYTKRSIFSLCKEYTNASKECFNPSCNTDPMTKFVKQQLGFLCGEYLPLFIENFECISSSILKTRHCMDNIYGMPNPFSTEDNCNGLSKYATCVTAPLEKSCGKLAMSLLIEAIREFNCPLKEITGINESLHMANTTGIYTVDFLRDFLSKDQSMSNISAISFDTTDLPSTTNQIEPENTTTSLIPSNSTGMDANNGNEQNENERENVLLTEPIPHQNISSAESMVINISTSLEVSDSPEFVVEDYIPTVVPSSLATELQEVFAEMESTSVALDKASPENKESTEDSTRFQETIMTVTNENTTTTYSTTSRIEAQEDEDYVNACFTHLVRRLSIIGQQSGTGHIRFPLFNISLTTTSHLCKMYDEGVKCAVDQLPKCQDMQIMQFLNRQLEALCFRIDSMKKDYECVQHTFNENRECIKFISTSPIEPDNFCSGQQQMFDCFLRASECRSGAHTLVKELIRGAGCRVDIKAWLTNAPSTTTTTVRMPSKPTTTSTTESGPGQSTSTESTLIAADAIQGTEIADHTTRVSVIANDVADTEPLTTVAVSLEEPIEEPDTASNAVATTTITIAGTTSTLENCSVSARERVRLCVAPLMKTWLAIREARPTLAEGQFPVYKYTRIELLELCDGYANVFLCAGVLTIKHCLKDELIKFAQDHLGYQCSPQNISRFLKHYDYGPIVETSGIQDLEAMGSCREHNKGRSEPGENKDKCEGVPEYAACMRPLVQTSCERGAVWEFQQTIEQFGCAMQLLR